MKILTGRQVSELDRLTSREKGIPSLLLMENAGWNLYLALRDSCPHLSDSPIAIFCGKGNNGGDGFVLARLLSQRDLTPDVYLLGKRGETKGDSDINLEILRQTRTPIREVDSEKEWASIRPTLGVYQVMVDALLGTGIQRPLEGLYRQVILDLNLCDAFKLSVDIPSGMFPDSLTASPLSMRADLTVTFTAPKLAHALNEDQEALGETRIVPIGTPDDLLERPEFYLQLITLSQAASCLLPRSAHHHKGHFGHVAIISGSRGKTGAAALAAVAALRSGSGLVTAYCPEMVQSWVASSQPEVMTQGLPCTAEGTITFESLYPLLDFLADKDAAGVGPGLSTQESTIRLVQAVVREAQVPLVLDADALNAFQGSTDRLVNEHDQPLILTPHPGEFARLINRSTPEILENRVELAREFAQEQRLWLVLKGFRTLLALPSGEVFVCPLGNPGMATAGMGDVLTGVLTSIVGLYSCRKKTSHQDISAAALLGVYLHALAGDLAVETLHPQTLLASDVIASLGEAYHQLESQPQSIRKG